MTAIVPALFIPICLLILFAGIESYYKKKAKRENKLSDLDDFEKKIS